MKVVVAVEYVVELEDEDKCNDCCKLEEYDGGWWCSVFERRIFYDRKIVDVELNRLQECKEAEVGK